MHTEEKKELQEIKAKIDHTQDRINEASRAWLGMLRSEEQLQRQIEESLVFSRRQVERIERKTDKIEAKVRTMEGQEKKVSSCNFMNEPMAMLIKELQGVHSRDE